MRTGEFLAGTFWLALAVGITAAGWDLRIGKQSDPGSGFMIFWVVAAMTALCLAVLVTAWRKPATPGIASLWAGLRWRHVPYVAALLAHDAFLKYPPRPDEVRFVSVLSRPCRARPALPIRQPASGRWLLHLLAHDGRYALGIYRRHMHVIRYLGTLDRIFGVPVTTRSWSTLEAIARALASGTGPVP